MGDSREITVVLEAIARGEQAAVSDLYEMVYEDLRKQASRELGRLPHSPTLNATAVVNESYIRLFEAQKTSLACRKQFFFASARAMRDVLIEYVRKARAIKRGGAYEQVELHENMSFDDPAQNTIFVHDALEELEKADAFCAKVVLLRFFGSHTYDEVAEALEVPIARVRREWAYAQVWLSGRMT